VSPAAGGLVLASASPRRRELLGRLGLRFEVRGVDLDETPLPGEAPRPLVERLALAKARAAVRPGELAIGADTVVALGMEPLGKPADAGEASEMLRRLSGRTHEVWTGVALVDRRSPGCGETVDAVLTQVRFRVLGDEEIERYAASGEPLDKAGAYAIQGGAAGFVENLDGDFENVVGLPLARLREMLDECVARRIGAISRRT